MNSQNTIISLEILLLNDLLREGVIDEAIYNKASAEIVTANNQHLQDAA